MVGGFTYPLFSRNKFMVVSCELNGYIWVITRSIDLKKKVGTYV